MQSTFKHQEKTGNKWIYGDLVTPLQQKLQLSSQDEMHVAWTWRTSVTLNFSISSGPAVNWTFMRHETMKGAQTLSLRRKTDWVCDAVWYVMLSTTSFHRETVYFQWISVTNHFTQAETSLCKFLWISTKLKMWIWIGHCHPEAPAFHHSQELREGERERESGVVWYVILKNIGLT